MDTVMDFGGNSGGSVRQQFDLLGGARHDASMLQFVLTQVPATSAFEGHRGAAATVYAPNATVNFNGTADLYGSILGKTITNGGNANIHTTTDARTGTSTWQRARSARHLLAGSGSSSALSGR